MEVTVVDDGITLLVESVVNWAVVDGFDDEMLAKTLKLILIQMLSRANIWNFHLITQNCKITCLSGSF